ncbi:hypothetical protein ACOMHN_042864 [Nucella lapillus]
MHPRLDAAHWVMQLVKHLLSSERDHGTAQKGGRRRAETGGEREEERGGERPRNTPLEGACPPEPTQLLL